MGSWAKITRRALVACCFSLLSAQVASAKCQPGSVMLRGDWGTARFSVETVDTPAARARGLMHRDYLAPSAGMLFLYDRPQHLAFWMRNTLIELDMLFIDPQGVVRHIHHRAQPLDETPISGGNGLISVLEINGGMAKRMGIDEGTEVQHSAFGAQAFWPCEILE